MWENRGHAQRISTAAKAAGCTRDVLLGFRLEYSHSDRPVLQATFSAKGSLHRSSVRARVPLAWRFATGGLTAADSTRAIIAWFDTGMPDDFDVMAAAFVMPDFGSFTPDPSDDLPPVIDLATRR
jgi:hypothetical protein